MTTNAQAAQRCIDDPAFATRVLDGDEGSPEVREALLSDLSAEVGDTEVQGFLNPQPLPPAMQGSELVAGPGGDPWSMKLDRANWGSLQFASLGALVDAERGVW